ncbi:MAG: hypothetical protein ACLTTH_07595 [Holdemanella porci]
MLQVVVYWIVFPYLFGRGVTGENYLIYLITGIIPWTFFMTSVNMGTSSIKANGGIIKKYISLEKSFRYHKFLVEL